jgi:uncharacterized protein HemY
MGESREAMFRQMVQEFPESPMRYFSLGRLLVDEKRWPEAVAALTDATRIDPTYAAAFVTLGDAHAALGAKVAAKAAWQQALQTPLGRRDLSLQADLDQRVRDLDDF